MKNSYFWPTAEPVSKYAIVTMTKDDFFFLDLMVKYYYRHLKADFYIIDHGSKIDIKGWANTNFPNVNINVIKIPNIPFDDRFKSAAISSIANICAACYDTTISSDVDEVVITHNDNHSLKLILDNIKSPFTAPVGVEFVHNISLEGEYNPELDVTQQRNTFFYTSGYSKPIIWKKQSHFSPGLHGIDQCYEITSELALSHMRSVDFTQVKSRQESRRNTILSNEQEERSSNFHWKKEIDDKTWYGNWIFEKAKSITKKRSNIELFEILQAIGTPQKFNSPFYRHDISKVSELLLWS